MKKIFFLLNLVFSISAFAQDIEMNLWENDPPGSTKNEDYIEENSYDGDVMIRALQVKEPKIYGFLKKDNVPASAVIIFPGGGYAHLSMNKEGFEVAKWLVSQGISAFVVKYRLPDDRIMETKNIGPLQDAQRAIRMVREKAEKWGIDPSKIGVMGFSAGGHLATTISTHYAEDVYEHESNSSARPDFSILLYPVVSFKDEITHKGSRRRLLGDQPSNELIEHFSNETQVNDQTPPTFIVHAIDDHTVPVANSLNYLNALSKNKVPVESHFYENGGHGFGLAQHLATNIWPELLLTWLKSHDFR